MSTRASLLANPEGRVKELGESVSWVPLLWIALISSSDMERRDDRTCVTTDRKMAVARCATAIPFLADQFPEFEMIRETGDDFLQRMKKVRAKTLGVQLVEHIAMNPETFIPCLTVAVAAIEAGDPKAEFTFPASTFTDRFTGKTTKTKAQKYSTTHDVLAVLTFLDDPDDEEDMVKEKIVGYLFA